MVFFFPKARISAAMALKHKYFNEFLEKDAESPTLLVEEEGKMDSIPIFEIHPNNAKINFNVTPIQESYRSNYLLCKLLKFICF